MQFPDFMKTLHLSRILACAVLVVGFNCGSAGVALADDHDAWSHDKTGYWDDHHNHHAFVTHENHHGYWRQQNGTQVFINID